MKTKFKLLVLVVCTVFACSKKETRQQNDANPSVECKENTDCRTGWYCLAGACASGTPKTIAEDPGNAVNAEKIKKHVEEIGKDAAARGQKVLDL